MKNLNEFKRMAKQSNERKNTYMQVKLLKLCFFFFFFKFLNVDIHSDSDTSQ